MDEEPVALQQSITCICEIAGDLFHPRAFSSLADSCDENFSCSQTNDKEDLVTDDSVRSKCFDCEEVCRGEDVPMLFEE